jgi:hypothetical protein
MQVDLLGRRDLVTLLGGAAAWPLAARAQQTPDVYPGSKAVMASRIEAILTGLRVSGYTPPAQVEIVAQIAEGDPDQIAPLVKEVIAKDVNVIIAAGPPVVHAAGSATGTIPIIAIDLESDPVASGMAVTLARPGGNITGVFLDFPAADLRHGVNTRQEQVRCHAYPLSPRETGKTVGVHHLCYGRLTPGACYGDNSAPLAQVRWAVLSWSAGGRSNSRNPQSGSSRRATRAIAQLSRSWQGACQVNLIGRLSDR